MRVYPPIGGHKSVAEFKAHVASLALSIPCDEELIAGPSSPLAQPIELDDRQIGNRFCIHPMEGWDGTVDGKPTEATLRRWRNFGLSGAKLIWGGEAVAVRHEGRANPNQLVIAEHTREGLAQLRAVLIEEHKKVAGSDQGLLIGLQLTHSGRYCRPNADGRPEPRILDRRLNLPTDYPVLSDGDVRGIIEDFHRGARVAWELGFDFVDVKHCHGYLGHEFLSAHTREGNYGGGFAKRTRFLREVAEGIS